MCVRWALLAAALLICVPGARSQEFQVGAFWGKVLAQDRSITGGGSLHIESRFAAGVHYEHRLVGFRWASLHAEVELAVLPPRSVRSASAVVPQSYSALYLTPGVALRFPSFGRVQPWVAGGGGYALYIQSRVLTDGTPYSVHTVNRGAVDFGGGIDLTIWRSQQQRWSLKLRGQVRDFISGNPGLGVALTSRVQHNVIASGGLLVARDPVNVP